MRLAYLACACALLVPMAAVQRSLERQRERELLTRTFGAGARGASLAVDTVVLGPFRGLRADLKWMKAIEMQDSRRFYEVELLCREILDLQPEFHPVRAYQAWNLAYNLAAETEGAQERWAWVKSGMDLLREHLERGPRAADPYYTLAELVLHKLVSPSEPYREEYLARSEFKGDLRKAAAAARDLFHRALRRRGLSEGKRFLAETNIGHAYRLAAEWAEGEEWWDGLLHRYATRPRRLQVVLLGWRYHMSEYVMALFEEGRVRQAETAFARLRQHDPRERRAPRAFFEYRMAWLASHVGPGHEPRLAARTRARLERAWAVYRRQYPDAPESLDAWLKARRQRRRAPKGAR